MRKQLTILALLAAASLPAKDIFAFASLVSLSD